MYRLMWIIFYYLLYRGITLSILSTLHNFMHNSGFSNSLGSVPFKHLLSHGYKIQLCSKAVLGSSFAGEDCGGIRRYALSQIADKLFSPSAGFVIVSDR
jgi:hypothetical protein